MFCEFKHLICNEAKLFFGNCALSKHTTSKQTGHTMLNIFCFSYEQIELQLRAVTLATEVFLVIILPACEYKIIYLGHENQDCCVKVKQGGLR